MSKPVVTRFAPSPTGFLHIGGARTALFNWLFAQHHNGKYLLRIEDTDRQRSTPEAVAAILDGLAWLELDHEKPPLFQSTRVKRHKEVVELLLSEGKAYRCFATTEELDDMRAKARAEGRPPVYDGRWRERDPAEAPDGASFVVRLKTPTEGSTIVPDLVQGNVSFDNRQLDDMVLLRSDGTPTYMLAVVVDDQDMGITHVIRGDDHLTNSGRQLQLLRALGWQEPTYAHLPMIHGPDGAKLSKRHGAVAVGAYRDQGYLPAAMRNYLVRLGWAHGDEEIFTTEQAIEWFTLEAVGRSPARMDFAKLDHVNSHYINIMDCERLADLTLDIMSRVKGWAPFPSTREKLIWAMPGLRERAKTLVHIAEYAEFLVLKRPIALEPKAADLLTPEAKRVLAGVRDTLGKIDAWALEPIEHAVRNYVSLHSLKLGQVAQPLRAALTGRSVSPGIFDVLAVLGREETLGRLEDQIGERRTE